MSFLNSVLSSIGTGNAPVAPPRTSIKSSVTQNTESTTRNNTANITPNPIANRKRKADDADSLPQHTEKALRIDSSRPSASNSIGQTPRFGRISSPPRLKTDIKYSGTARNTNSAITPTTPQMPIATSSKPPKKGSYADILARAKAAQAAPAQVGVIKHKAKEKLTRKERLAQEAEAARAAKEARHQKPTGGQAKPLTNGRLQEIGPIKKKQPASFGYKGTARPRPDATGTSERTARPRPEMPAYKGTMNRASSVPSRDRDPPSRRKTAYASTTSSRDRSDDDVGQVPGGRYRYASYSDEEEEEYESEELSDMEAGADEIEEEEALALRAAKREDEEALKEEQRLKAEKLAKKKRLEEMAARARQKKSRY
ncbi:MAG: hypothetical protein M1834_005143 [Cirrosporium novae-zelandiae]|nr:MAG: hypothetical protein M1834_005143 [Cirrosporium novae-zelandiae]